MSLRNAFILTLAVQAPLAQAASLASSAEADVAATISPTHVTFHRPLQNHVDVSGQQVTLTVGTLGLVTTYQKTCHDMDRTLLAYEDNGASLQSRLKEIYLESARDIFIRQNPALRLDDPTGRLTFAQAGKKFINALADEMQKADYDMTVRAVGMCNHAMADRARKLLQDYEGKNTAPAIALVTPHGVQLYERPLTSIYYDATKRQINGSISFRGVDDPIEASCSEITQLRNGLFNEWSQAEKDNARRLMDAEISKGLAIKPAVFDVQGRISLPAARQQLNQKIMDEMWYTNIRFIGAAANTCDENSFDGIFKRIQKMLGSSPAITPTPK